MLWRRRAARWGWWSAAGLIVASILLAIFVHRGLLGISGLVFAVVVAWAMLRPSKWRWPIEDDEDEDDEEDEVRTAPPG
ncbi:MAG TPA: hypothetical protein VKD90_08270 [Gemmataceae bacterium]|nr:hypothetical protein [Gemmataceae bacterium]